MRRLLKGFLIAAGILVALACAGVLAINLYVQSAGTQKRIEHALSSGLKVPVHVTSTIVTPWSGLKASGITVEQLAPRTGNFLEAASFDARFSWMGLLKHQMDASEVSINEPQVTWFQSANGKWELPRVTATAAAQASPAPPPVEKEQHVAGPAWEIRVHKLMVNGASFDFWDEKGMRMLEFAGVQFNCLDPKADGAAGQASAKNISLHDKLFFRDMQTNWSFANGLLKLTSFTTAVGGGQIRGDAQVATQAKHSPFNADVSFDHVDVNQLMSDSGHPAGEITGMLNGSLDLNGNSGKASSINGSGHLELSGGRLQNIEILQLLGQGLQIPDLIEMNLKEATVDARVVSGVTNVDKLVLQSQNLELSAHGTIGTEGQLALDARLAINGVISRRLPDFILTYFKTGDTADEKYIDFGIGNTLTHPRTNLLDNLLGKRIQSGVSDIFKMILGKKKPKESEEPPPGGQP